MTLLGTELLLGLQHLIITIRVGAFRIEFTDTSRLYMLYE